MSEDVPPGVKKSAKLEELAEQASAWLEKKFQEAGVLD